MSIFLQILFCQAVIAINTAIIVTGILRIAQIKKEREEKTQKTLRDFTPPPEKKPPKPLTTGTSAIEPKPKGVNIVATTDDCNNYGETIMLYGRKYRRASIWVSADKKVASMEYVEVKEPKVGVSTEELAEELRAFTRVAAGLGGNYEIDELKEKLKTYADTLDGCDKKPVTPERLKEAGFAVEPVCSCFSMDYRAKPTPPTSGVVELKLQVYPRSTSDELKAAIEAVDREQKENLAKMQKPERESRKCKYYDDSGGKFGLCVKNEEIVDGDSVKECWTGKTTPVKAKARPISRPAPLGTVTVPERRKP